MPVEAVEFLPGFEVSPDQRESLALVEDASFSVGFGKRDVEHVNYLIYPSYDSVYTRHHSFRVRMTNGSGGVYLVLPGGSERILDNFLKVKEIRRNVKDPVQLQLVLNEHYKELLVYMDQAWDHYVETKAPASAEKIELRKQQQGRLDERSHDIAMLVRLTSDLRERMPLNYATTKDDLTGEQRITRLEFYSPEDEAIADSAEWSKLRNAAWKPQLHLSAQFVRLPACKYARTFTNEGYIEVVDEDGFVFKCPLDDRHRGTPNFVVISKKQLPLYEQMKLMSVQMSGKKRSWNFEV